MRFARHTSIRTDCAVTNPPGVFPLRASARCARLFAFVLLVRGAAKLFGCKLLWQIKMGLHLENRYMQPLCLCAATLQV